MTSSNSDDPLRSAPRFLRFLTTQPAATDSTHAMHLAVDMYSDPSTPAEIREVVAFALGSGLPGAHGREYFEQQLDELLLAACDIIAPYLPPKKNMTRAAAEWLTVATRSVWQAKLRGRQRPPWLKDPKRDRELGLLVGQIVEAQLGLARRGQGLRADRIDGNPLLKSPGIHDRILRARARKAK